MTETIRIPGSPCDPAVQRVLQEWRDLVYSKDSVIERVGIKYPLIEIEDGDEPGMVEGTPVEIKIVYHDA